jgi:endonuclease/exonuclease/phosphatase (EEP) superfamily protein YafD
MTCRPCLAVVGLLLFPSAVAVQTLPPEADTVLCSCTASIVAGKFTAPPNDCEAPVSSLDSGVTTTIPASANPADRIEWPLYAPAGQYTIWARLSAVPESPAGTVGKWNNSVFLSVSENGNTWPVPSVILDTADNSAGAGIGGWRWMRQAYWLAAKPFTFTTTGVHHIRISLREDGVAVDQVYVTPSSAIPEGRYACSVDPGTAPIVPTPPPPTHTADAPPVGNTTLPRLRVLHWNVAGGYNSVSQFNDYPLQMALLTQAAADVVVLNEMSYADTDMLTMYRDALSAATGKPWRAFYQRGNTHTDPRVDNVGSAMLTWLPVDTQTQTLDTSTAQPFAIQHLQVTINGVPVHIFGTHLYPWDAAVRQAQIGRLKTYLDQYGPRRILSADLNADPEETGTWTELQGYRDAWVTTTSVIQPTDDQGFTFDKRMSTGLPERIDYQWYAGVEATDFALVKTKRSDHHMILVNYKVAQ